MKVRLLTTCWFILLLALGAAAQGKGNFFKTSDGVRIHYLEAGSGQPIVFIPGWTMPAWIWEKQITEFAKNYHVIAVDPRAQGESDRPSFGLIPETRARDYKELVDHLNLKKLVLVGWSMACGEELKYAEQFGTDNLAGLVLVDGYVWDKLNPQLFVGLSGWMNQLQQDRKKQADGFVRMMYKKPQPEEYLQRVMQASMSVPDSTAALLIYNMIAVQDFSAAFNKVKVPVLFAYQASSQPAADLLKSKLGDNVRLERFDDAGHALFVDDPEKFNRTVETFVQALGK